ncbi:hypothetical protein Tco_0719535 [Tanacetum coccineum]
MLISKKKGIEHQTFPLLEHSDQNGRCPQTETALLLRLLEQCSQLLSFHYHFRLKQLQPHAILRTDQSSYRLMERRRDPCVNGRYSTQFREGYRVTTKNTLNSCLVPQGQKASDYDNSDPVPPRQNVVPTAEKTDSSHQELEFLFSPLIEEYYTPHTVMQQDKQHGQAPMHHFKKLNYQSFFMISNGARDQSIRTRSWKSNHVSPNNGDSIAQIPEMLYVYATMNFISRHRLQAGTYVDNHLQE